MYILHKLHASIYIPKEKRNPDAFFYPMQQNKGTFELNETEI